MSIALFLRSLRSLNALPFTPLAVISSLALVENILNLVYPMLAGQFTKTILSGAHAATFSIHTILSISFLMVVTQALLGYALNKLSRTTGERSIVTLRNRLFSHLQFLPISILSHYKHGELLSLITNDCGILSFFAANTLSILPSLVISSFGALFAIFLISPLLSKVYSKVGFKTQPHFTRAFKEHFGISPSDYGNTPPK